MRRTRFPLVASNRCQEVKIMKLVSALVGLAALGGVALSSAAASAMPVAVPAQASPVVRAAHVCNEWAIAGTSMTTATVIIIRTIGSDGTVTGVMASAPTIGTRITG